MMLPKGNKNRVPQHLYEEREGETLLEFLKRLPKGSQVISIGDSTDDSKKKHMRAIWD
jgi:hypothetical protein